MTNKNHVICLERLRRVPRRFSWVDHRLIRDQYANRCRVVDLALYLILVTAGDRNGMSFYSDRSLAAMLKILPGELSGARSHLRKLNLIAWETPFYQILSLDDDSDCARPLKDQSTPPVPATGQEVSAVVQNFLTKRGE